MSFFDKYYSVKNVGTSTTSHYPFGIFKLFFMSFLISIPCCSWPFYVSNLFLIKDSEYLIVFVPWHANVIILKRTKVHFSTFCFSKKFRKTGMSFWKGSKIKEHTFLYVRFNLYPFKFQIAVYNIMLTHLLHISDKS